MTCHNTTLAKIHPPAHESPYSIELSITRQSANQGRSVEVRELEIPAAVMNGFTALRIPVAEAVGLMCPGKGATWPSAALCSRALNCKLELELAHLKSPLKAVDICDKRRNPRLDFTIIDCANRGCRDTTNRPTDLNNQVINTTPDRILIGGDVHDQDSTFKASTKLTKAC